MPRRTGPRTYELETELMSRAIDTVVRNSRTHDEAWEWIQMLGLDGPPDRIWRVQDGSEDLRQRSVYQINT